MARALAESHRHGARGLERVQRAAPRRGAGRRPRSGLRAGRRAGAMSPASSTAAASGEIEVLYLLGADEIDTRRSRPGLCRSIRAITATAARRAPMSCCRARPIPRRTAPTSTPRAACSWAAARCSRPATRARIGRSLRALSGALGQPLPFNSASPNCAGGCAPPIRASREIDAVAPAALGRVRRGRGRSTAAPFAYPIADFYRTDPISRATPTMAECSEHVLAHRGEAGADGHAWLSSGTAMPWPTDHHRRARCWRSSCRC